MADQQHQITFQVTLPTRERSVCTTCSSASESTPTSTEALIQSLQVRLAILEKKLDSNNMPRLRVFYLFPKLPGELRKKIWLMALRVPRIVHLMLYQFTISPGGNSALRSVNREARQQVSPFLTPFTDEHFNDGSIRKSTIFVNCDLDTVLYPYNAWVLGLIRNPLLDPVNGIAPLPMPINQKLKSIAIPVKSWMEHTARGNVFNIENLEKMQVAFAVFGIQQVTLVTRFRHCDELLRTEIFDIPDDLPMELHSLDGPRSPVSENWASYLHLLHCTSPLEGWNIIETRMKMAFSEVSQRRMKKRDSLLASGEATMDDIETKEAYIHLRKCDGWRCPVFRFRDLISPNTE